MLDYVLLRSDEDFPVDELHRAAVLAAIAIIDARLGEYAAKVADDEFPADKFFRLSWDATKLSGKRVSLSEFWGGDSVEFTQIGDNAWTRPNVDGYKTAFFLPPHGLWADGAEQELFERINKIALGDDPTRAEIFSWSTNWSNYFDAGHEYWGAYYWTVRPCSSDYITVIAASTTD